MVMASRDTLERQEQELLEQLELLKRQQELLERLAQIRRAIDEKESNIPLQKPVTNGHRPKVGTGVPKNDMTWERYVVVILSTLGRKLKSSEIRKYATDANPDTDKSKIEHAITNKLSKLYRDGVISAEESTHKKDGYLYYITEQQKKAADEESTA